MHEVQLSLLYFWNKKSEKPFRMMSIVSEGTWKVKVPGKLCSEIYLYPVGREIEGIYSDSQNDVYCRMVSVSEGKQETMNERGGFPSEGFYLRRSRQV